jgi:hypothetical protein
MDQPTTFLDFCELLNVETFGHEHENESVRLSITFFSFLSVKDLLTLRGVCRSTSEIVDQGRIVTAIMQGRLDPQLRTNFYVHQT